MHLTPCLTLVFWRESVPEKCIYYHYSYQNGVIFPFSCGCFVKVLKLGGQSSVMCTVEMWVEKERETGERERERERALSLSVYDYWYITRSLD